MSKKKIKTITTISKISGAAIGASIGTLTAGPLGGLAGGAIGEVTSTLLTDTFTDFLEKQLSKKEISRTKTVFTYAEEKFKRNIDEGKPIRNDINPQLLEETLEETLLMAKVTTDERKLIYLGNLYANILFEPKLQNDEIYYLLKVANNLLFKDLCFIALFGQKELYPLREGNYREYTGIKLKREFLLTLEEVKQLEDNLLVDCEGVAVIGITDLKPSKIKLTSTGSLLYSLMELGNIERTELEAIQKILNYSKTDAQDNPPSF